MLSSLRLIPLQSMVETGLQVQTLSLGDLLGRGMHPHLVTGHQFGSDKEVQKKVREKSQELGR